MTLVKENSAVEANVNCMLSYLKKNDASTVRQSLEVYSRLSIGEAQVIYDQLMLKFPV